MDFIPLATGHYLEALAIDGETVWFSDVVTGGVQRLAPGAPAHRVLPDRRMVGSVLLNADGALIVAGAGGYAWFDPASERTGTLIDAVDGVPLAGVNEFCADGAGGIYFGSIDLPSIERGERPGPSAIYHLAADGGARLLRDGLAFANGIATSLDGAWLFHNESFVGVFAYPILPGGGVGERRMLLDKPDCDGMALDAEGMIWITGFASPELLRVAPDGTIVDRVALPAGACTNVRFGGADGRDLYVTTVPGDAGARLARGETPVADGSILYRARSPVAGRTIAPPAFALAAQPAI